MGLPAARFVQIPCNGNEQMATISEASAHTLWLDLLTVRGNDDTLDLVQLHVLRDLPQPHDQPPPGFGSHGVLLVDALLETDKFLQKESHTFINFFRENLITISGKEAKSQVIPS